MGRRLLRALFLAVLSAVTAEFLLGDQYLTKTVAPVSQQIAQLVLYTAFYGCAAILIREVTRRRGRGWPSILLLALAFGVIEEGLLTQSLFNPNYLHAHLLDYGFVGWLGTAPPWAVFVLTLHVVWSMAAPIAVAEGAFPDPVDGPQLARFRGRHPDSVAPAPWLGRLGIGLAIAAFLLGATGIFAFSYLMGDHFVARTELLVASAVIALILVAAGLFLRPRPRPGLRPGPASSGRPILPALLVGLALSTGFQLVSHYAAAPLPAWVSTLILVVLLAAALLLTAALRLEPLGLAFGALLTYGWVGLSNASGAGARGLIEQSVIVLAYVILIAVVWRRRRPTGQPADGVRPAVAAHPAGA